MVQTDFLLSIGGYQSNTPAVNGTNSKNQIPQNRALYHMNNFLEIFF